MTRWIVGLVAIFALAALTPSLADASKPEHPRRPSGKHKHHHKKRGHRTVKSRGGPLSLHLGTVAISAPKGAIRKGQTLTIEKGTPKKFPALGTGSIAGGPFTISTSQGEPAKPVKVTFHYNPASLAQGGSPVVLHGWSAFGNWVPEQSAVSSAAKTVSAKLDSFSPLDVVEDITWAAGLITGNRTDLPSDCGAAPSWVNGLSFPDAPNDSLPSCIGSGSNASTLYIHVVNNRGYAQFITASGASIDVLHSSWGDSLESTIANGLAKLSIGNTPSSFLLAPGSRATLAIDRPPTSFGETTVTLHSAPQGSTAAAAMGWALLNKLKAELGSGVDATNCVIGYLHNTLSANPSVSSVVGQLHSCVSAAAAGLKGSAKTAAEKIASAMLVTDFFYKLIDLAADELYPPQISFSIPGKNPTNPDIHLGNLDFGAVPAEQQTIGHLTASGGTAPYSFAVWNDPTNLADVPSWANVASDGTVTINPPPGTDRSVSFFVYATDENGEHSPFARDKITFTVSSMNSSPGMSWSAFEAPLPTGKTSGLAIPEQAACSPDGPCVAIGFYEDDAGERSFGMIDTYVEGSWTAMETPVPVDGIPGSGSVGGEPLCSATGICAVLGSYENTSGNNRDMIDTFIGGAWKAIAAPQPSGDPVSYWWLDALRCSNTGTCIARGGAENISGERHETISTLASDGSWQAAVVPVPAGGAAGSGIVNPDSFACSSPTTCLLIGEYDAGEPNAQDMTEVLANGSWHAIIPPMPAGGQVADLNEHPACFLTGCVLLGYYEKINGEAGGMIDTVSNNGSWMSIQAPVPPNGNPGSGNLQTATCTSIGTCVTTGEYENTSGTNGLYMIDTLFDGNWASVDTPVPSNGALGSGEPYEAINPPACSEGGGCAVLGVYQRTSGDGGGMLDTFVDGHWSSVEAPVPTGGKAGSGIFGSPYYAGGPVCSLAGACVIIGAYEGIGGEARTMTETFSGGTWTALEPPVPAGGTLVPTSLFNNFSGSRPLFPASLACSTSDTCAAVGDYRDPGGEVHQMIDTLGQGVWTTVATPVPASGEAGSGSIYEFVDEFGPACSSAGVCVGVGEYSDPGAGARGLIVVGEPEP